MLYRSTLLLAASAALASAATEDVTLVVKSDDASVNDNTLSFMHEGAGTNYVFLGTAGESTTLQYDADKKTLVNPNSGIKISGDQEVPLAFGLAGNFVSVSVSDPGVEVTFKDDLLAFNGTTDGFHACKNTNDPYNYSEMSYELMHYSSDAPSGCIKVTVEKKSGGAASSSSSVPPHSTTSDFEGAAAGQYAPAGVFALVAGVAAALI